MTLLSTLAVPVAGAGGPTSGAVGSVDAGDSLGPLPKDGPPAGKGGGNGGGSSSDDSDADGDSDGGGDADGGAGSSAADSPSSRSSKASGDSGGGAGSNDGSSGSKSSKAGGSPGGSSNDAGPPDRVRSGGDGGDADRSNAGGTRRGEARRGGPAVSVSTGPPDDRGRDDDRGNAPGRSDGPTPSSVVSVSVEGARAGDRVDVDVSPASVEDDPVAFDGVSVTVKRGGDFTMEVTNSREALPGSPDFEPEAAADALGRIRLEHSITNEEVEDVSYRFRVSKARLAERGTDFEQVSLYRYADGEWSELPTDVVGETDTHYLLSADSPGMSEFAVGAKRPDFDTYWADVDADAVETGSTVTVSGRVTNQGGADGVYVARLSIDGEVVEERAVTVAAGGTRQVNFRIQLARPGDRSISIEGVHAGEVVVRPASSGSAADRLDRSLAVVVEGALEVGSALGVVPP